MSEQREPYHVRQPVLVVHMPTPTEGPPTLNRLIRRHWSYRDGWITRMTVCIKQAQGAQHRHGLRVDRARLGIVLYYCGVCPDTVNVAGIDKCAGDALVRAGVLVADDPAHLVSDPVQLVKVQRKQRAIVLTLWEEGEAEAHEHI